MNKLLMLLGIACIGSLVCGLFWVAGDLCFDITMTRRFFETVSRGRNLWHNSDIRYMIMQIFYVFRDTFLVISAIVLLTTLLSRKYVISVKIWCFMLLGIFVGIVFGLIKCSVPIRDNIIYFAVHYVLPWMIMGLTSCICIEIARQSLTEKRESGQ